MTSPSAPEVIRVMCVDDHRIVREGITAIVDRQSDMRIVSTASTGEEAVAAFMRERPDVTLMDLQLPRMTGLEAIKQIRQQDADARVIVLTMYQGDEDIHRALAAGAATYLLKDTLSDDLIRFVREVHNGRRPIRPDVRAALDERAAAPTLTPREIQVMELVAEGRRNKEIASALAISEETVQVHLRNIFAKLKVSERTAALNVAIRRGIVHIR